MNLPQELTPLKNPCFEISGDKILIKNKPFFNDYFAIAIYISLCVLAWAGKIDYRYDYLVLFIAILLLLLFAAFSCERVAIDLVDKKISRYNTNMIVNIYRKKFKIPSVIDFSNVKSVEQVYGKRIMGRGIHNVYINTDDPCRVKIAIFEDKKVSDICESFLKALFHLHDEERKRWDFLFI